MSTGAPAAPAFVVKAEAANGHMRVMKACDTREEAETYAARFPQATEIVPAID